MQPSPLLASSAAATGQPRPTLPGPAEAAVENAMAILCLLLALTVFWIALQLMKLGGKRL